MAGISDLVSLGLQGTQVLRGWQEVIYGPDPAAGAAFTRVVPGDTWERVLAVNATFTTSAVVATRFLAGTISDGQGVNLLRFPMSAGQAASTSMKAWAWQASVFNAANETAQVYAPLPDLLLKSGWQFSLVVTAMDAGDQISGVHLIVQRFPTHDLQHVTGRLDEIAEHARESGRWAKLMYERMAAWLDGTPAPMGGR